MNAAFQTSVAVRPSGAYARLQRNVSSRSPSVRVAGMRLRRGPAPYNPEFNRAGPSDMSQASASMSGSTKTPGGQADVNGTHVNGTHVNGAQVNGAHVNGAQVNGAHVNGVHINGANVNGTHVNGAAVVKETQVNGTHVNGAHVNGAHVNGIEVLEGTYIGTKLDIGDPPSGGNDGGAPDDRPDEPEGFDSEQDEISAMLRKANRKPPANVGEATKEQIERMLAVEALPVIGALARSWPALRYRLMANGRLPLQLATEVTVGCFTKTLAEYQGRGKNFWKEFDFYLSDLALEIVGDAMLVWLLSPIAVLGDVKAGRMPMHAGQVGNFGLGLRAATFAWKGVQFATVGFFSSALGHSATRWLVARREAGKTEEERAESGTAELAPVIPTSLTWGGFMLASSNTRYQVVNCVEERLVSKVPGALGVALTFATRFGNCYLGGVQWLPWARFWGIQ